MLKVVGASWLQTKISSYVLGALGLLAIVAIFLGEVERSRDDGNYAATVFYTEKLGYRIEYWGQSNQLDSIPKGVARAYYRQDIDTTGWAQLEIETDPSYKDKVQAYAAGMLEGALTWQTIYSHLLNTVEAECSRAEKNCNRIKDQLERAVNVDKKNVAKYEDDDPFWHQVGLFYDQIDGIFVGWKYGVLRSQQEYKIESADLYWLNAMSEIREMKKHLNITTDNLALEHLPGLSSALLRVVDGTSRDKKKVLVAHNTAGNYNSMIRIIKRYQLNYHVTDAEDSPLVPGSTVQFTGYPAAVSSHDEMYILSGKGRLMAITGTSLNNFNKDLWRNVNITEQVPIGPRLSAANRLAPNVSEWIHIMARNNSGTACKQWMVVDLKQLNTQIEKRNFIRSAERGEHAEQKRAKIFKDSDRVSYTMENNNDIKHTIVHHGNSGKVKNVFWLMEQVPGYTHSGDLSATLLKQGYWATYGLPYFKDIVKNTKHPEKEALFGNIFSYTNSPRAVMFKESANSLANITSIINLMRSNNMTYLSNNTNTLPVGEEMKADEKTQGVRTGNTRCDDGTLASDGLECVMNEKLYWVNLAVRGDLTHQYKYAYGVIDTKVFSGDEEGIDDFAAISGPTFNSIDLKNQENTTQVNKGNVAKTFKQSTKELIRDNRKHNNDIEINHAYNVPPFSWSKSKFTDISHELQPNSFAFAPFKPNWVW